MSKLGAFVDTIPLKVAICRLAGLDPGMVRSIHIDLSADKPTLMQIERWVPSAEHEEWDRLLEDYLLVKKEEPNG